MRLSADMVRRFAAELTRLPREGWAERVKVQAEVWHCSASTVRRRLAKDAGLSLGKARGKGASYLNDADVRTVMALVAKGVRKGRPGLPINEAIELAWREGLLKSAKKPHPSTLSARARRLHIGVADLLADSPAKTMRSLYGNHVHQLDPSLCIQWRFGPRGLKARYVDLRKIDKAKKVKQAVHRWVITDHATGAFHVHYFDSPGESVRDLLHFLWRAWSPKEDARLPFCGLPEILYVDRGPAFISHALRNLCAALDIQLIWHAPGLARATGSVESNQWFFERFFEAKLRLQPIPSVEALNEFARLETIRLCATRPHTRHRRTRFDAWQDTVQKPLKIPVQDFEQFCWLAHGRAEEKTVRPNRNMRWDGVPYHAPTAHVGSKITLKPHPFIKGEVRAFDSDSNALPIWKVELDALGFPLHADVFGASTSATKKTAADQVRDEAKALGQLQRAFLAEADLPEDDYGWVPLPQEQVGGYAVADADEPLSRYEAKERLVAILGRPLTREEGAALNLRIGDAISAAELQALIAEFTGTDLEACA